MRVAVERGRVHLVCDFMDLKIIIWNVCGMGNRGKRVSIRYEISGLYPDILCLQETKLESMYNQVKEVWGSKD